MKDTKEIKGITLIALVITIIVLLILAGVSIAMLTDDNGILNQANRAKEETEISSEREAIQLTMINKKMTNEEKYNIGEELRDRTLANGDNWKIVSINETKEIYGTNWYYVGTGINLENYGETKHEWLINYNTEEVIELPEKEYTKLAYGDNLAVKDGIILNADPINMGDSDSWGEGVKVYGINEGDGYGWNETEFKLDGVDDYIEVYPQSNVNMENGLTFEFYARSEDSSVSMLSKTVKGDTNHNVFGNRFRTYFLNQNGKFMCCMSYLASESEWTEYGVGPHWIGKGSGGSFNSDVGGYLTMTADIEKNTVYLYWNGEFVGSTTCSHEWMVGGELTNNDTPFTIGFRVQGNAQGAYTEYYSKVDIYACRLYNKVLTEEEVKANYDNTVAYHNVLVQSEN